MLPLTITDYELINQIVQQGSLAGAAKVLNITPSAASHSLIKIERRLGTQLFIRDKRHIELSKVGRDLMPFVSAILRSQDRLEDEVDRIQDDMTRTIRIGTFNSTCCLWLPDIIDRMRQRHPETEFIIMQGSYDEIEYALEQAEVDFAFVSLPVSHNISAFPLIRDPIVCITKKDFTPKNGEYVTLNELTEHKLILEGPGNDHDAQIFLQQCNIDIATPHRLVEDSSIMAMVKAGLGISIAPHMVMQIHNNGLNNGLREWPIETSPYRTIGFATRQSNYMAVGVRALIQTVRHYISDTYPEQ